MMAKKGKILVITFSFPTKVNQAAGIFILNQLEYLKRSYDIKVLNPYPYVPPFRFLKSYKFSKVPFKESIGGIEVYRPRYLMLPRNSLTLPFITLILTIESVFCGIKSRNIIDKLAKGWDFDIIHSHGLVPDSVIASKAKEKYRRPLVITLHGEDVTKYSKMPFLKGMSKRALKYSDRIICVSNSLKKEVYERMLSDKNIDVVPSGYNVKRFRPLDTKKCRKSLNLPRNRKIILFVGHLVERKGLVYLIRALKILNEKNNDFLCCIVGSGKLEKKLKSMASESGIKDNVAFAGQRDPDEIPLRMNASDILVLPSLNEGLPNVVSEAMACGKPVVATNVAGNPEIVSKDAGFLAKPKDEDDLAEKILLALNKKWDRKKLLRRAKDFSVINSVKKIDKVYSYLLEKLKP